MKLTYATAFDSGDIHKWSGLGFYYARMLREAGFVDFKCIDLSEKAFPMGTLHWLKDKFESKILGKEQPVVFTPEQSKSFARTIYGKIGDSTHILSPNTVTLAYLKKDLKKILYTDSTFDNLLSSYPNYFQLNKEAIAGADTLEGAAIANADLLIYTSQWAADSAIQKYRADPQKVFILPFGANLKSVPDKQEVTSIIQKRTEGDRVNLLFIGVQWERKGGDYAVEVTRRLNESGIPATLHIIGIRAIPAHLDNPFIINHGFISKNSEAGEKKVCQFLAQSSFLLLPSLADCTPVAFSEAAAFGLPCLASAVGGNTGVIKNGINGKTFPLEHFVEEAVTYITSLVGTKKKYEELCFSSFETYCNELNWSVTGSKFFKLINSL